MSRALVVDKQINWQAKNTTLPATIKLFINSNSYPKDKYLFVESAHLSLPLALLFKKVKEIP